MELFTTPVTFQSLMNAIFYHFIHEYFVVYLDNLLVYSNSVRGHLYHLQTVLSRFS